jgi:hypothetical protein
VPLFLKNRLKFNDAFFINGDTRHNASFGPEGYDRLAVKMSLSIASLAAILRALSAQVFRADKVHRHRTDRGHSRASLAGYVEALHRP